MNNIRINLAESIFEPFWDTGESYPDNYKYSRLTPYKITTAENASACAADGWCSVTVTIQKSDACEKIISLERDCTLEISDYDMITAYMIVPENISLKLEYISDVGQKCAFDEFGNGGLKKFYGKITGNCITSIKLSFGSSGGNGVVSMFWLGLAKSDMLDKPELISSFSDEWEGCFETIDESFEAEPDCGIFFDKYELKELRKKIENEPFAAIYSEMKDKAEDFMKSEPEKEIRTFFPLRDSQFGNDYGNDIDRCELVDGMQTLAFVGITENNANMLRMACRMALCAASSKYWCEHILGEFAGATWHHRSFTEYKICFACSMVLDWAGKLLTWHGKNIIYNAMIMKGLPRIEADFKTMDYIYECNQGFMFNKGRTAALIALSRRFPRYKEDIEKSEQMMYCMLEKTVQRDGGTLEGPAYWAAVVNCAFPTIYMLARYKGVPLNEYLPDNLKSIADYGLVVMSDFGDNYRFIPVSDTPPGSYSYTDVNAAIVAYCSMLSNDRVWKKIYNSADKPFLIEAKFEYLIMAPPLQNEDKDLSYDGFGTLNYTGLTALRTTTKDAGAVRLLICGGKTCESHMHGDKGSIVLEVNGVPILVDPGTCGYSSSQSFAIQKAEYHNLLVPQNDNGIAYNQPRNVYGGRIKKAEYNNGLLDYSVDLKEAWEDKLFIENIRNIKSSNPHAYVIEDIVEFTKKTKSGFYLHTYGKIENYGDYCLITDKDVSIKIKWGNYIPDKVEIESVGIGGQWEGNREFRELHRLKLILPECVKGTFRNIIEVIATT